MKNYHIAVIDVGKTNKKVLIYDADLNIVEEKFERFPEIEEGDVLLDDVASLKKWLLDTLSSFAKKYDIRAVSVSSHGATYSLVDENGEQAAPQVAYNTDPGDDFHDEFYEKFGDPVTLQQTTATPNFNLLINVAKGIWFTQKRYPEQFKKAKRLLLYPQYFGYWLTGNAAYEPTYVGNHTYLWNFGNNSWSEMVDKLGIRHLLPENFNNPWDLLGTIKPEIAKETGLREDTIVTTGIHDSNAAMLPYLLAMKEPFLLNTTGTWCVIMNEKEEVRFEEDELGKVVFYNLNAFRKPVKTAIFLGGMEFEYYSTLLQKLNNVTGYPSFNESVFQKVIDEKLAYILPSVAKGIGQFPESKPRVIENDRTYTLKDIESGYAVPSFFKNYEEAMAVLNLSLAVQTKVSFDRADMQEGMDVFTEGGFSKNDSYNALMTSFYPKSSFYLTGLKEASAYGAALIAKAAIEKKDIRSLGSMIAIDKHPIPKNSLRGMEEYAKEFLRRI